ncbi:16S rRNA (guanine(527)-N(7))-methyltransferase RsmG [Hydrogenivirga sp. 128-5-R1-1]|uniref:16S rRNA (guanine(527)-N(7))-methyltransferase RsmG n=1 Tax=Hydrogenivirga sp. 128-5-R1-1 TaxID=392423 RepID=UPI00015EF986|nr:16S rRNA (guanine(527)-N(7))-methyltransferase RsmG [Hydrogenivirga sp. 128-5-R1-1]EDP75132.1 glucose inhibited division protein B [Hydrogenivirga sp. 128-5-R1-1]
MPELIERLFSEAGFELSQEDAEKFGLYLEELKRWNRVHNLTSVKKDEEIVRRHFIDSLSLVRCFVELGVRWQGKVFADVGSGAGFPGVPLKIYLKDIELFLIESVSKKCSFLEYLKLRLNMDWTVICERAERVDRSFDIVVSRAMGEFEEIHRVLENLSREYVFVMKGKELRKEWTEELGYTPCRVEVRGLPPSYILWKRLS